MVRFRAMVSFRVSVSIVGYRKGQCGKSKEFSEECYCRFLEVIMEGLQRSIVSGVSFKEVVFTLWVM